MSVYREPQETFLGLHPPLERSLTVHTTSDARDITAHEVGKFMRLALKSNPSILELLWLPDWAYEHISIQGEYLLDSRHWFASAELVKNAYLGYATQQFKLLERDGNFGSDMKKRTEKHARHLYRLLLQGFDLYRTGALSVQLDAFDVAKVREFGQRVGQGDLDLAKTEMEYYEAQFRGTRPKVREEPNIKAANSLLIEFRKGRI
jgi:predicted nucleotidyltransferase